MLHEPEEYRLFSLWMLVFMAIGWFGGWIHAMPSRRRIWLANNSMWLLRQQYLVREGSMEGC